MRPELSQIVVIFESEAACSAVTLYHFQIWQSDICGLELPGTLRRAMPRAFAALDGGISPAAGSAA
jgi:hypothetical protein